MVIGFCGVLLFLFVPESFWDRTPSPKSRKTSTLSRLSTFSQRVASNALGKPHLSKQVDGQAEGSSLEGPGAGSITVGFEARRASPERKHTRLLHVGFAQDDPELGKVAESNDDTDTVESPTSPSSPISETDMSPLDTSTPGLYISHIIYIQTTPF
jgi:hypothetical protein